MVKIFKTIMALLVATAFTVPVLAQEEAPAEPAVAKLTYGENKWIDVHYLLQVQGNFAETWNDNKDDSHSYWSKGVMVRRSRIILKGQVAENVTFFMETDDFKIGANGNTENKANNVFTQDAYINYKISDAAQIAAGMILLPFMHHDRQSAVSLLGVDYNGAVIPFAGTTNVWRDTGVEVRGLLVDGLVDYRVGVFQGVPYNDGADGTGDPGDADYVPETPGDDINPYDELRYTGRVQINLGDPEAGFFYSGNYLGKKSILSFGGGVDYQNHAVRNEDGELDTYMAWTADVTVDRKIGDMVLALQGAYVNVTNQPGKVEEQNGYFVQAGLLVGNIQPVVKYMSWTSVDGTVDDDGEVEDEVKSSFAAGVNYFINGHNANIKAEYVQAIGEHNKDGKNAKAVNIQCQIFI